MLIKPEHCCGLPEMEVRAIAKDIGGAIEYLHKNRIIHRDLKPENIILRKEGEERVSSILKPNILGTLVRDSV